MARGLFMVIVFGVVVGLVLSFMRRKGGGDK
jgi:uncharacterized membrane protein